MRLIQTATLAQGWLEACEHLLAQASWVDTTVVLHIDAPTRMMRQDKVVAEALDTFLVDHGKHNNHTVAETIFPGYEYVRRGREGVFRCYPEEIFPHIKKHPDARPWGTYAHRLLRRTDRDGREYNPLEELIKKMMQKQPVRAAYEVGLGFGADIATYDDDEDRGARLGGPCLSHLSFKLITGRVHLTALYRSHYYIQRAYGNLLGLARLQAFVADQVGVASGPLVCHSTMAVLEHGQDWGWKKAELPPLIAACRAQITEGAPVARVQH
jgi:hypothetical protein